MTPFGRLSGAGFIATAITYGPARIGFGLFVPEFRDAFDLGTQAIGWISSAGFLGFLLGLPLADFLLSRLGPRAPVIASLIAATLGMGLIASAPGVPVLAAGVFLAMSSAGFSWAPFNNAVHARISADWRPTALSRVSTGTTVGIVAAAVLALAAVISGLGWRAVWIIFTVAGAAALIANWVAMRGVAYSPDLSKDPGWWPLVVKRAIPLYAAGLVTGLTSAVYISFAADRFQSTGGLPGVPDPMIPALVYIFYGLFGVAGLATDRMRRRIGLVSLLRILLILSAVSLALVTLFPGRWTGLIVSAGLQGLTVMMLSAAFSMWADSLFPDLTSRGMTALLLAVASGSVLGPVIAGAVLSALGGPALFLGAAALPLATALWLRRSIVYLTPPS